MADNTGHGLSTGKEKSWSPRYEKCLRYGGDYVEIQCGSSTIKCELFFVQRETKSPQYMVFKIIYLTTLVHTYEFV